MGFQFFGGRNRHESGAGDAACTVALANAIAMIGDTVGNFTGESTQGTINFHEWAAGNWVYMFSGRSALAAVCTTEFANTSRRQDEFATRKVKPIAVLRDPVDTCNHWASDIADLFDTPVSFPILSDPDGTLLRNFGMIHPKNDMSLPVRKSFIIDPQMRIRMILEYPARVGRSLDEVFRVIDALQEVEKSGAHIPGDWHPGNTLIVPMDVTNDEATRLFGRRWRQLTNYLRIFQP